MPSSLPCLEASNYQQKNTPRPISVILIEDFFSIVDASYVISVSQMFQILTTSD